ncbi:ABC transporter permease [uncultured Tessaracoccus sp.]|uniref:ABC transporter permease n=1 Tax=uncultured Tessaracoccus sp. TaxID=905023 RepID=UPI0025E760A6|nr:FtsX-like permease family protein [uncultured Tessaracoccus sp.]
MKPTMLLREALATTWANKVPSALVTVLVALMVGATIGTVGRTAAAEQELATRLDDAGSRVLTVTDARAKGLLPPDVVLASSALSITERAVGQVLAKDVVAGHVGRGGERVPAWGVVGDVEDAVTITAGRRPRVGEALVSGPAMTTLGLDTPYGWVVDAAPSGTEEHAVVGSFTPRAPFDEFAAGVIYVAGDRDSTTLSVVVDDPAHASAAEDVVLGLVAPETMSDVQVTSPVDIATLRAQVVGDFGRFGRTLLLGVLAGGALLIAVVVLADALVRRKDLGRRRALGATRGTIIALVTTRTLLPALVGAAAGMGGGWALTARLGASPPLEFMVAVAVLAVLTATVSAIPPASFAAWRDPVQVLRTP